MKKNLLLCTIISAFAMVSIYIFINSRPSKHALLIQNVEALAAGEDSSGTLCKAPWTSICTTLNGVDIAGTRQ